VVAYIHVVAYEPPHPGDSVGALVGAKLGFCDVGDWLGNDVVGETLGRAVGDALGRRDGDLEGTREGEREGLLVAGARDGIWVGRAVGFDVGCVGDVDGFCEVGEREGECDGLLEGDTDGLSGRIVGLGTGFFVGLFVG